MIVYLLPELISNRKNKKHLQKLKGMNNGYLKVVHRKCTKPEMSMFKTHPKRHYTVIKIKTNPCLNKLFLRDTLLKI